MDKEAARNRALEQIRKKLKIDISSAAEAPDIDVASIPTGSLGLDVKSGVGGYPMGRIIEIYGKEASGKTTLTLHAIAECQKQGGYAAFVDAEQTFHKEYAASIGVDLDELTLFRPNSGEEALQAVEALTQSAAYDVIVIDSVSALVPTAEVEGDMGASHVGLQARLMGQALRKLISVAAKTQTAIMFINQTRQKIGVMFGSNETTSGGMALPFYATLRLKVVRTGTLTKGDDVIGNRTKVQIVKNKLAGTAKHEVEFNMYANNEYGSGISYHSEVMEAGVNFGHVEKSGAWYTFPDGSRVQGIDNAVLHLRQNDEVFQQLNKLVRQEYQLDVSEE